MGDVEEPPYLVKGTYTTDLNINKIHEAIIARLTYYNKNNSKIKEQINILEKLSEDDTKPENEIKMIHLEIKRCKELLDDYENNISLNRYLSQTKEILAEYGKVISNKTRGIIFFKNNKEVENQDVIKKRLHIIRDYLEIAKEYIQIEIIHKFQLKATCPGCQTDLSNMFIEEDFGLCVCPKCGYERENISHNSTYKDSQRINIGNKNNYDDCENFRKALHRFQGKQFHRPPAKLYEQLDVYFAKINKPLSAEVHTLPMENGKKRGTSREMMFEALSETNNSAYYDDINLILNVYWGWELPDISHLEERIMEDYINTQQVYNSIKEKDRNASLNVQFRLYVHLKAVGYNCSKDDFKIQTSRDSLIFHNDIWKLMCEKTGVKFHSVI